MILVGFDRGVYGKMGEGYFNFLGLGKGFLEEDIVLSENKELELIGFDRKLGMIEARRLGRGLVFVRLVGRW